MLLSPIIVTFPHRLNIAVSQLFPPYDFRSRRCAPFASSCHQLHAEPLCVLRSLWLPRRSLFFLGSCPCPGTKRIRRFLLRRLHAVIDNRLNVVPPFVASPLIQMSMNTQPTMNMLSNRGGNVKEKDWKLYALIIGHYADVFISGRFLREI